MAAPFVDRIEGTEAILIVDGAEKRVPVQSLPKGAREGVCLTRDLKAIDPAATKALQDEIRAWREKLKKDDGGDFSL